MAALRRGRRPAGESRAAEIRGRLLAWKQTPEPQRISLRALAAEIGTSHQLLSFHLRRLHRWQVREYEKKAREIHARARAENRPLTQEEQMQCAAHSRASLGPLVEAVVEEALRQLWKQIKQGQLSGFQLRMAKLLARKGYQEAQEILNVHFQRANNLPAGRVAGAKSFRSA